jgi:tetratricopeptide (TPR) repeat protein
MARINKPASKPGNDAQNPKHSPAKVRGTEAPSAGINRYLPYLVPSAIAVITWLMLMGCLDNQFTNWDDPGYITSNPHIRTIDLTTIFTTSCMGNYHPLTMLTYALEYSVAELQPLLYHTDSLVLHLMATLLAYVLTLRLTRQMVAAGIAALLFGLHPMHVEAYAWLSGRKDLLYSVFYLASCLAWLQYIRRDKHAPRIVWYTGALLLFIASLLSKPVAVVLPFTLLLLDYLESRTWSARLLIEKIPHFALALCFGLKAIADQKTIGATAALDVKFNFFERIALGCYACTTYLWKAIAPANLCNFYPYPSRVDDALPVAWYSFIAIVIAIIGACWFLLRKNRNLAFGTLFFLVNILLLLQFIPVGGAIIADRYAYLPYFGLFFIIGWLVSHYYNTTKQRTNAQLLLTVVIAYSFALGFVSRERCKVWYNSITLWQDEVSKLPETVSNAWNNLGTEYATKYKETPPSPDRTSYRDSAIYCLSKAVALQPANAQPYLALAAMLRGGGRIQDAKALYHKAIPLTAPFKDASAWTGLATIYAMSHNTDSAMICFRMALNITPFSPGIHSNFGNLLTMTGQPDSAIAHYTFAITQNPLLFDAFINRGRLFQQLHRCDQAMADFEKAISLRPDRAEIYYLRSLCFNEAGNKSLALQDVEHAIALGFRQVDKNYYQSLRK